MSVCLCVEDKIVENVDKITKNVIFFIYFFAVKDDNVGG